MGAADWYARKLGQQPQAPAQPPQPVYTPPVPTQQGLAYPGYTQQPPVVPQGPPARAFRDPNGQTDMGTALREWEGGEGTRTETHKCPRCGSGNFFTRQNSKQMGKAPAPHCFNCGYNELFEQFSDQFTAYDGQGGSKTIGMGG